MPAADTVANTAMDIDRLEAAGLARSVYGVQILLALVVVLYLLLAQPVALGEPGVALMLGAYASALALLGVSLALGLGSARLRLALELACMIVFITALLAITGMHAQGLANLYFLPIVASAFALGRTSLLITALFVTLAYVTLTVFAAGMTPSPAVLGAAMLQLLPLWLVTALSVLLLAQLRAARARIQALADSDALTGLLNARAFERFLAREHDSAQRYQRRYSLLMVSIEDFARLGGSDTSVGGMQALRLVSDALLRVVRTSDALSRLGEHRFAVFLAETPHDIAETVAQRIRNVVFATTLRIGAQMQRVQVSVGVASYPDDGTDVPALLAAAERAMQNEAQLRKPPPGKITVRKR